MKSSSPPLPRLPLAARRGSLVQGAAALLWLPQAALLAWAVQRLADGAGFSTVWALAAGIVQIGRAHV